MEGNFQRCRVCGSSRLVRALDLGRMPSANSLVSREGLGLVKSYPLVYYWCGECTFFQQLELIGKEDLFGGSYVYATGASRPTIDHFTRFAEGIGRRVGKKDFAVVVASNDGTELAALRESGGFARVLGVEPAKNLAEEANRKGLRTINGFFSEKDAAVLLKEFGPADLVVANNVMAHIPDPKDFLMGLRRMAGEEGIISVEAHWLASFIKQLQIDTLYGEHYYVWSVGAMKKIAEDCGLVLADVEFLEGRHGGSVRFILKRKGKEMESVAMMVAEEEAAGVRDEEVIRSLQGKAEEKRDRFAGLVKKLCAEGKNVSVWTVPAKIVTLLNFSGLTSDEIRCAYDNTPFKIGKYIPKAGIRIKDEKEIEGDMPDFLVVGAWNYIGFGKEKLRWYLEKGGRFINPLTMEIIGTD